LNGKELRVYELSAATLAIPKIKSRNEICLFTPVRPVRVTHAYLLLIVLITIMSCVCCLQKAYDRSWKPVWAVVRGQTLCLYKEKRESVPNISVDVSTRTFIYVILIFSLKYQSVVVISWSLGQIHYVYTVFVRVDRQRARIV